MNSLLTRHHIIFVLLGLIFFDSCDFIYKDNGLAGHSPTKEDAIANGSPVFKYIPEKYSFQLLDGTKLLIDTAWTEVFFYYHDGKRVLDDSHGYHLTVPITKKIPDSFTFSFSLTDKNNQAFTNGAEEKSIRLCPMTLYKEIGVLLEQKDPDTSKGWTHAIITDTIIFRRVN